MEALATAARHKLNWGTLFLPANTDDYVGFVGAAIGAEAAMKCLLADREGLTAYLRFPAEHHQCVWHSNFIERTFGETRRRTKVIGRLPARPTASPWSGPRSKGYPAAGVA